MPKIKEPETKVGKALKGVKVPEKRKGPLWLGPMDDSNRGGVTQSMLNAFLCCRERFRLKVIEGLQPTQRFQPSMDFGTMWHACEEIHSKQDSEQGWEENLKATAKAFCVQFPLQQDEVNKWYNVCKVLFPIYVDYWAKDKEQREKTPLLQEYAFNVPYELPSGRVVHLRGKFDAVDLIGKGKLAGIWLQENKTKSEIDEEKIRRNLKFDLQTMLYLIALQSYNGLPCDDCGGDTESGHQRLCKWEFPIKGVRYNVIRRPLAGGKGSIRQHAPTKAKPEGESQAEFYERLRGVILEDVGTYFLRIKSEVFPSDIERFKKLCLNPLLEQLCDWYDYVTSQSDPRLNKYHYMSPHGLYNPLIETGQTDLDNYLETGSTVGLHHVDKLFTELQ